MRRLLVFTDLDGSLLDSVTHSFEPARSALELLRALSVPVVLVSSKTRAEIEQVRAAMGSAAPFVVEHGGAVFAPTGYFGGTPRGARKHASYPGYDVMEMGTPYPSLRQTLSRVAASSGVELRGFGDMSPEEVGERTGLSRQAAVLAQQRAYDEPFVICGPHAAQGRVLRTIEESSLHWTRAGRFHHLMGANDKGTAIGVVTQWYRERWRRSDAAVEIVTVGIGDSLSDRSMFEHVDCPILVQRPDGTYDPDVRLPGLSYANGAGPVGWSLAVMDTVRARMT